MQGHGDLVAWRKSMQFGTDIYRPTRSFPHDEVYGWASQIRRAAVAIPSNLAEGSGRNARRELRHFIGQARGSPGELETQLEIAGNLAYLSSNFSAELVSRASEIGRMLNGLKAWSESSEAA